MFQTSADETFEDGQVIFEEGSSGDWIYIVESGAVELYKMVKSEKVVIEVLQSGDVFGELAFFARIPRTVSARAVGATAVGIVDRNYLDEEFNRLSGSFRMILKNLVLRLEKTTEKAAESKLHRKEPRVPKVLSLSFKSRTGLISAFSEDMSAGGIFIKTAKPLPEGERFLLKLKLPDDSDPIEIESEVSWNRTETDDPVQRPPGMGIKFVNIRPADRHRLKEEIIKAPL
ncbi:MAG: TIGR02266 family protein [Deltaproteobacteria bacterium]|nr:TIGR02266 family protein [Deltaproteobacteria bacterium]